MTFIMETPCFIANNLYFYAKCSAAAILFHDSGQ